MAAVTARAALRPGLARRFEASILLWAGAAGVLGFLVLVPLAWLFYASLQRRLIGRRRFALITGKGGVKRLVKLGRWRWPALGLCPLLPLLSIALPYGALLATSLSHAWGKGPVPGNLTLYWYQWALFVNEPTQVAISHSPWYSAAAATIAMIVAVLVAYVVQRKLLPASEDLASWSWRRSSSPASCWPSASSAPTPTRPSGCTARPAS